MQLSFLNYLRCPVTRTPLTITIKKKGLKTYNNIEEEYVEEAVLWADKDWFYPVVGGIPRLTVEAMFEYESFLEKEIADFRQKKDHLLTHYKHIISKAGAKNRRTKKSFAEEWSFFNYEEDTTWGADAAALFPRFLEETGETTESIKGKLIFDAGCGNGLLDILLAREGARVLAMDLGKSIERAFAYNDNKDVCYIQGDVQFPPVAFDAFDIVHSSGVLHHTNNTELSFACIAPCVKEEGKLSVWLYTPRPGTVDKILHFIRGYSSKLPLRLQYFLYYIFIFPPSYIGSRIKGSKLNGRELMINIYDSLSCEFCWLHQPEEVHLWYAKHRFAATKITTSDRWGFNIIGTKKSS
jgi:2-polyprenyl-3-methyl-5-hydroxy-6-metoxy-1,4-benzoquinol methylase